MKVFKCVLTGEEFYSDAKPIHEDIEGMVWQEAKEATEGGVTVDTGGGNAFGGGDDEELDDAEETKLDHFWQFDHLENEVTFSSFKKFKKEYFIFFVNMCKRLAKEGKIPAEHKDSLKDNLKNALKWIEANFDSLQFYTTSTYLDDYAEYPDEDGDPSTFAGNMAYLTYGAEGPKFHFVKGVFNEMKL